MRHITTPLDNHTTEQQDQQKRIQELERQNQELKALVDWYKEQFRLKQHQKFGASSEKYIDGQTELPLFNEAEITASPSETEAELETAIETTVSEDEQKKRKERKTQSKTLPVETVTYTLPEEEQACLCCGNKLHVMKKEIRRELIVIPAEVKILQHERDVFACRTCEQENITTPIIQSPMPNPVFPKSMASPSSVAYVLVQKYMAGVPLYRQEKQFEQLGVSLSRQTMSNWILSIADQWVDPLIRQMKETLIKQGSLHADETTVQVLNEPGRAPTSDSYMWVYRTGREGPNCILFDYQTTRSSKHPKKFLKGYKGTLHADGYRGYDDLPGVTLSGCWAHARRYFDQAHKAAPPSKGGLLTLTEQALQKIGAIYKIEKEIVSKSFEDRLTIRQERSLPLVEAYFTWLKTIKSQVLPKSKLGEAIQYSLNQQKKLLVPFHNGRLDIDNNRAERSIKPFVIGRKNWLFSNSSKGARASAQIYSIIETAKENNLHVFHYLVHLFETLPNININDPIEIKKLLPWSEELPGQCYLQKEIK